MAVYAIHTNRPFIIKGEIPKEKKLSEEDRQRIEWIEAHLKDYKLGT